MSFKQCLTLLLIGVLASTITASEPKWFENKTPSKYPISEFIIGFGKASSSQEALTLAQSEIAAQIETRIYSTTSITQIESNSKNSIEKNTTNEATLSSVVEKTLRGIDVVKREKKEDTVYIMAVLSKKSFLSSLEKELDSLKDPIESKQKKAKIEEFKLNIGNTLQHYKDLEPFCKKYHENLNLFNAFSPDKKQTNIPTVSQIKTLREDIVNGLSLKIKSGNYQTGKAASILQAPIVFEATYKERPLIGTKISIHYSDGTLIKEEKTDMDGETDIELLAIPFELQKTFITASLPIANLTASEQENLQVSAYYSLAFSQLSILKLLPINEPNEKALAQLFKTIESFGITFDTTSPFLIEAELEDSSISSLSGAVFPQYIATITWNLRIRLQNGDTIATIRVKGKGINKDREKAELEAYQKLDISKTTFYEFISKFTKIKAGI